MTTYYKQLYDQADISSSEKKELSTSNNDEGKDEGGIRLSLNLIKTHKVKRAREKESKQI